jgi:hypothetical protein
VNPITLSWVYAIRKENEAHPPTHPPKIFFEVRFKLF